MQPAGRGGQCQNEFRPIEHNCGRRECRASGFRVEWTFRLSRASVSTQLLPAQLDTTTVLELKRRFVADVLVRHGVDVREKQVRFLQARKPVPERRRLVDCPSRTFVVAFLPGTKVSLADALEQVRYRIRTRFRPDGLGPGAL